MGRLKKEKPVDSAVQERLQFFDKKLKSYRFKSIFLQVTFALVALAVFVLGIIGAVNGFGPIALFVAFPMVIIISITILATIDSVVGKKNKKIMSEADTTVEGIIHSVFVYGSTGAGAGSRQTYMHYIMVPDVDNLLTEAKRRGNRTPFIRGETIQVKYNSKYPTICEILTDVYERREDEWIEKRKEELGINELINKKMQETTSKT